MIDCLQVLQVPGEDLLVVADRDESISGWSESDAANEATLVRFATEDSGALSKK